MKRQNEIRDLMQANIVLAVGCTEPVAVALAAAKAKEVLAEEVVFEAEIGYSKEWNINGEQVTLGVEKMN